jgi:hypothetical protein
MDFQLFVRHQKVTHTQSEAPLGNWHSRRVFVFQSFHPASSFCAFSRTAAHNASSHHLSCWQVSKGRLMRRPNMTSQGALCRALKWSGRYLRRVPSVSARYLEANNLKGRQKICPVTSICLYNS